MQRKIFKYPLEITDIQTVLLPIGATILKVAVQYDNVCIWALVNPDAGPQERVVHIVGTGNPFEYEREDLAYLDSVQHGPFVWHIFIERLKTKQYPFPKMTSVLD